MGADVSKTEQVEAAVERVAGELGGPTVLVNNAGVIRDNLLFKMTDDDWDTVLGVHLRGAFLMSRAVQKYMVEQRYGRIVNLSSSSALGNRGQVNYSAAKAGMQGFTKTLAIELGPFGITANAVAPGFIVTDMTAATAARIGMPFEDFQQGRRRRRSRCAGSGSPRTWRTPFRSWSARARASSPARSSTWPAGPCAIAGTVQGRHCADTGRSPRAGRAFLAEHDPHEMPRQDFLDARFDAGLAWVHYPEGLGGLGLSRSLQQIVDAEFAAAGSPGNDADRNAIGLGMAAPTILAYGTDEQQQRWLRKLWTGQRDLVPAVQRAGRGQRPGRAGHPGGPRKGEGEAGGEVGWSPGRRCGPRWRSWPSARCCSRAPIRTCPSTRVSPTSRWT